VEATWGGNTPQPPLKPPSFNLFLSYAPFPFSSVILAKIENGKVASATDFQFLSAIN